MGDIVLHMCTNLHGHLCLHQLVIGTFSLFRNVFPEAISCCLQTCYVDVMLDCMCIPTFIVVTVLVVYLHTQIALYYNVWPKAIFLAETESKGLTNFLV